MPHSHPTILIVDDNDDVRDGLTQLIRAEGYTVETAQNGREALNLLHGGNIHPCIILLDLMMPDMTGYAFRTAQIANEELEKIPIVVYSGIHDIAEAAQRMGAVAYAPKPIVLERLIELIRQHCLK